MCRMEQLYVEHKFDPQDDKPLDEVLAIPLQREIKKTRKRKQDSFLTVVN